MISQKIVSLPQASDSKKSLTVLRNTKISGIQNYFGYAIARLGKFFFSCSPDTAISDANHVLYNKPFWADGADDFCESKAEARPCPLDSLARS